MSIWLQNGHAQRTNWGKARPIPELRLAHLFCERSAISLWAGRAMLQTMAQAAQSSPSPCTPSFSGLLASLTSGAKDKADHTAAWCDDELGDDVVTLSYERALRNHARYRPADCGDLPLPASAGDTVRNVKRTTPEIAAKNESVVAAQTGAAPQTASRRDLRTASVTLRLSDAECALVRQRAAEAELTVSAYLRSCVLEADALRAQVKEALAEMRKAGNEGARQQGSEQTREQESKPWLGWIGRKTKRKG
jgi:hypothetical protein